LLASKTRDAATLVFRTDQMAPGQKKQTPRRIGDNHHALAKVL
jgi:hypothetical protein